MSSVSLQVNSLAQILFELDGHAAVCRLHLNEGRPVDHGGFQVISGWTPMVGPLTDTEGQGEDGGPKIAAVRVPSMKFDYSNDHSHGLMIAARQFLNGWDGFRQSLTTERRAWGNRLVDFLLGAEKTGWAKSWFSPGNLVELDRLIEGFRYREPDWLGKSASANPDSASIQTTTPKSAADADQENRADIAIVPGGFRWRGKFVALTAKEGRLLELFKVGNGEVVTVSKIREKLYSEEIVNDEAIGVQVSNLRQKLTDSLSCGSHNPLPLFGKGAGPDRKGWGLSIPS